jgi:hypothetical protein
MDSGTIIAFAALVVVVIAIAVLLSRLARDGNSERGHLAKIELHRAQAAERARKAEAAADAAEPLGRRTRARRFAREADPAQEPERRI